MCGVFVVMGDDAGGASVGLHLVSPLSRERGLYSKAIMMSGSDLNVWAVTEASRIYPKDYAVELAKRLGCPHNDGYVLVLNLHSSIYTLLDCITLVS